MKRLATIALALLAVSSAADSRKPPKGITLPRGCRDRGCVRERSLGDSAPAVPSYAFFEFAPADGAGMGAACACTTPTGAKGETLTFTRGSSATCLKGSTTSIAVGDMVTCSTNQARVMPGGSGTGPLGLLVERDGSNVILRSEEFDNAAWTKGGTGVAAPTVTANFALAPDGTMTADRVQIPAAGVAQESIVYQLPGVPGESALLHIRGNGTSGTIDLHMTGGGCSTCSFNATTFTPCVREAGVAATHMIFGNTQVRCGGGARAAVNIIVWGAHEEQTGIVGSYIKTVAAGATRADDIASIDTSLPTENVASHRIVVDGVQQEFNATVSTLYGTTLTTAVRALTVFKNSSQYVYLGTSTTHAKFVIALDGVETSLTGAASFTVGAETPLFGDYLHGVTSATQRVCIGASCSTQTAKLTLNTGDATVYLGGWPSGVQVGAVVKLVTIRPSSSLAATAWSSDSITAQSGAYQSYARSATRVVDMLGVSGAGIGGCAQQWTDYRLGRDTRLVIECGINDIGGGSTGASVWAATAAYVEAVQAQGVEVIVTNMTPFKGSVYFTAPHETQRLAYNTAWSTYCGLHPSLACVNIESAVWDPLDHAQLDPTKDSGDHLHPNSIGGTSMGDAVFAEAP